MTVRLRLVLLVTAWCLGSTCALFAVGSLSSLVGGATKTSRNTLSHSNINHHSNPFRYSPTTLHSNTNNDENESAEIDNEDETLMRLRLVLQDGVDMDQALAAVQSYTQSFPFAVILPVQPMQYLPTLQGGVDVLFMRKKTQQKGSVDGGLHIQITSDGKNEIEILAKRNSQGQVVSKMFSEKLIVQALVKAFAGDEDDRVPAAPTNLVTIQSVFHKWLDTNQVAQE